MRYRIHIDGAARGNPGPAGYGIAVFDTDDTLVEEAYGYLGEQTNNVAEYCGLLAALELSLFRSWPDVIIRSDSQLMVKQLSGEYKVKNATLKKLFQQARQLQARFRNLQITHVMRGDNKDADRLANTAVDTEESRPAFINPLLDSHAGPGENFTLQF